MPDLKPELSERSKYWISKHRYYELKHFCLQYPDWKRAYSKLGLGLFARKNNEIHVNDISRINEELATRRADLAIAMELVERCVEACTDEEILRNYIFMAVTEGLPYVQLQAKYNIPCSKDMYYDSYRKFFWLLSQSKGI